MSERDLRLGQAHAATLRDGREVVVKVQRPDIRASLADDIEFFRELAKFMSAHLRAGARVDMVGVVQQLERALADELDYRIEARHARLGPLEGMIGLQGESTRFSAEGEEAFAPPSRTRQHALFAYEELATADLDEAPPSVERLVELQLEHEKLDRLLRSLSQREEQVLRIRYGFYDGVARTLAQTGAHFGISRERVRQIESRALGKLRSAIELHDMDRAAGATVQ